ncbi:MAG: hypothetical protein AAGA83_15150 [Cyanobacteria bacterium P01_F01_bin.116]
MSKNTKQSQAKLKPISTIETLDQNQLQTICGGRRGGGVPDNVIWEICNDPMAS